MSYTSYEDGRAGRPVTSGTDMREYNRGERDRKEADAAWTPAAQKVEVPGVAYTILLIAPMLFLVYPVLGLTLYAVAGAMFALVYFTPLTKEIGIFIGFIVCVFSFFPGFKLEVKASQFKPYRVARTLWRVAGFSGLPAVLAAIMSFRESGRLDPTATGGAFSGGIMTAVLVHFLFRRCDRMYFPVWAEVEKSEKMQAKGILQQRGMLKRVFYGLLWIFPVMAVSRLTIRLLSEGSSRFPEERMAFYDEYEAVVYLGGLAIWFVLALAGILPGTGKKVKSFIDHEALLEQRPQ